jgi:CubicO group peptidase (beta-lactamase class C family)
MKNLIISTLLLFMAITINAQGKKDSAFAWRQYADPAMAGWSNERLQLAWDYAVELRSASIMVVYKGSVVAAWGDLRHNYKCHSIRKGLLNALIGIYVDNGTIDLDATLADIGIDDETPLSGMERQATVEHLLQSRSGIYLPAMGDGSSMIANKPPRGSHRPGEAYHYNNWGFNALGTIFQQETGRELFREFEECIAIPLGMEDFSLDSNTEWRTADYTRHGYYFFRMSTRDLARFGLLYLHSGKWQGSSILSADWVARSTQSYSETGIGGYGYMWKTFPKSESARYGFTALADYEVFWVSGIGVHVLAVVPSLDLVFVHRFDSDNSIPEYEHLPVFRLLDLIVSARTEESTTDLMLRAVEERPLPTEWAPVVNPESVSLSSDVLERYVGWYRLPPVTICIVKEGDHLQHIEADGSIFDNLYPESEELFFYENWDRKIQFETDAEGRVIRYYLITKGVRQEAKRIE